MCVFSCFISMHTQKTRRSSWLAVSPYRLNRKEINNDFLLGLAQQSFFFFWTSRFGLPVTEILQELQQVSAPPSMKKAKDGKGHGFVIGYLQHLKSPF